MTISNARRGSAPEKSTGGDGQNEAEEHRGNRIGQAIRAEAIDGQAAKHGAEQGSAAPHGREGGGPRHQFMT